MYMILAKIVDNELFLIFMEIEELSVGGKICKR